MPRQEGSTSQRAARYRASFGHWVKMLLWTAVAGATCGCQSRQLATPQRLRHGLILVLPGIEGKSLLNHDIAMGLADAGVPDAIEIHDWTVGRIAMLYNLAAYGRNRRQAEQIARRIEAYQRTYPGRPVHLIGHSAGAAMAVLALEELREGASITAAILLGAALSPDYDLTKALKRTEFGIYNFYSAADVFYLGAGTTVFGTVDRKHAPAAGMTGFQMPRHAAAAAADLYRAKLHQIAWRPEMFRHGHPGGHLGWASRRFAQQWLSKIILAHRLGEAKTATAGP